MPRARPGVTSDQCTSNRVLGMASDFSSRTTRSSSVFEAVRRLRLSLLAHLRDVVLDIADVSEIVAEDKQA